MLHFTGDDNPDGDLRRAINRQKRGIKSITNILYKKNAFSVESF